jgi:hypothetical protein
MYLPNVRAPIRALLSYLQAFIYGEGKDECGGVQFGGISLCHRHVPRPTHRNTATKAIYLTCTWISLYRNLVAALSVLVSSDAVALKMIRKDECFTMLHNACYYKIIDSWDTDLEILMMEETLVSRQKPSGTPV